MIDLSLRKPGDIIMYGNEKNSPFYSKGVNLFSDRIPETPMGYSHTGIVDYDPHYFIEATPPRARRIKMDSKFWKKNRRIRLELWRVPGITREQRIVVIEEFYNVAFKRDKNGSFRRDRKGRFIGYAYDWLSIISLGKINSPNKLHCAEIVFISYLAASIVLKPLGIQNLIIQPNQIILSRVPKLIYREGK